MSILQPKNIVSWNVNSINMRLTHLERLAREQQPDIILLQETKCMDIKFPREAVADLGYNLAIYGQKSYNGVAILSKTPIEDINTTLPGNHLAAEEARYIEGITYLGTQAVRVASVYVPNGMAVSSPNFTKKMQFFEALSMRMAALSKQHEITFIGGDLNVAPDKIDVYDPVHLEGTVCFHPEERKWFKTLLYSGYKDSFRAVNNNAQEFSWWDYRAGSWQHNKGMRIDHILVSPEACDLLNSAGVHTQARNWEKPSDHAPVYCVLNIE